MKSAARVCLILIMCRIAVAASTSAASYLNKPLDWYRGDDAKRIADAILSYQAADGGWPKNIDTAAKPYDGDRDKLHSTFDNKATTDELRYVARMYDATKESRYKDAFIKGLDLILKAQYSNGGWPQYYPPPANQYNRYITFNDGAMGRLMFFVKEVSRDSLDDFVDGDRRKACAVAWDRGIDCILKCQVKVDGKLTVWCAQHDEKTLEPRPARTFELTSLSGAESVGLVHVLMAVEKPTPEVINAVDAAVAWFDAVKIPGIKVVDTPDKSKSKGFRREVVKDASAPPMWARFYEIGTNKPIFSDRDSVKKYDLSEIGDERRNGYKWLGYWPADLIAKEYPAWKAKLASAASRS